MEKSPGLQTALLPGSIHLTSTSTHSRTITLSFLKSHHAMPRIFLMTVMALYAMVAIRPALAEDSDQSSRILAKSLTSRDWPWWRGPQRNGNASADQRPPHHWSESENIVWKSPVPGRGHSSPTVVGDRVFILTAEQER